MEIIFYNGFKFSIGSSKYIVTNVLEDYITFADDSGVEQQYNKYVLQTLLLFSDYYNKEDDR